MKCVKVQTVQTDEHDLLLADALLAIKCQILRGARQDGRTNKSGEVAM